jgi:MFS family permease
MSAFAAGALIAALSNSLWIVVAGRGLQGLGGAVFPLCFGLARDLLPGDRVARSVGWIAAMTGIGGSLGLIAAGPIVDHTSWHAIFWISVVMGATSALAARFLLRESPVRTGGNVDIPGAVILGAGMSLVLFAISRIAIWGWLDTRTVGVALCGLVVLAVWVRIEQRAKEPLADIALLRSPPILMTNAATVCMGMAMMAIYVIVPQLVQAAKSTGDGFGLDATGAGLVLFPGSLLMMALSPVSAALGARLGNEVPLALGGSVASASLILLAFGHGTEAGVVVFVALAFAGIGLTFAAMSNLIIELVDATRTGEATAFNFVSLRFGNSLGAQVGATILAGSAVHAGGTPSDYGYELAFVACAVSALACALVAYRIRRVRAREVPVAEISAASSI